MAFKLANWAEVSVSLNQGQETVTPFGGSPTLLNAPNVFIYGDGTDNLATINAADYFLPQYASLCVGDWILVSGSDASEIVIVATSSSTGVTVTAFGAGGPINTADIVDDAVTYAKLQDSVGNNTLLGNAGGGAGAEFAEVTLGNGLAFSAGALGIPITNVNYAAVPVSAAEFNGMYAAPKVLVAAPGANRLLVLDKLDLLMTYGSAAFAVGGVVAVQYDVTANGAGVIASTTRPAADFFATASTGFGFNMGVVAQTFSTCVNKSLALSNITSAFTTGTGSSFVAHIWYKNIPTV